MKCSYSKKGASLQSCAWNTEIAPFTFVKHLNRTFFESMGAAIFLIPTLSRKNTVTLTRELIVENFLNIDYQPSRQSTECSSSINETVSFATVVAVH